MDLKKGVVSEIVDDIKDYIDTSVDLYKLQAIEQSANFASSLVISIIIAITAACVLLFLSIALAIALSSLLNSSFAGFLIVAGIYAVIMIIVVATKDSWIKSRLVDNFIKAIFSK